MSLIYRILARRIQMANFTLNPLRKNLLAIGLLAFVGSLAVVGFATYRLTHGCDVTVGLGFAPFDSLRHDEEVLSDIAAVGIGRSPDPRVLFEEFAKRFSVMETSDRQGHPRDIRSIAKAGGGDRNELVFVLVALFRLNGIDTESVDVYGSPEDAGARDRAKVIRKLVLVPALDRVFDPALPPADQHEGSGEALLDGISRVHYGGGFTTYQCPNSIVRSLSHGAERRGEREPKVNRVIQFILPKS